MSPASTHQAKERRIGLFLEIGALDRAGLSSLAANSRAVSRIIRSSSVSWPSKKQRIVPLEGTETGAMGNVHGAPSFARPAGRTRPADLYSAPQDASRRARAATALASIGNRRGRKPIIELSPARPQKDSAAQCRTIPSPMACGRQALRRRRRHRRSMARSRPTSRSSAAAIPGSRRRCRLAESGAKVAALEAVEIGFGGAGRNVGLVNAGMWVMPREMPKALGSRLWRTDARTAGRRAVASLGDDRRNTPSIAIPCATARSIARSGPRGSPRSRSGRGKWASAARRFGCFRPPRPRRASAPTSYAGALLDMRAGTIQPLAYARGLARAAIAAGAAVHTQSPVLSAERTGKTWTLSTERGRVEADWVVVATDAYGGAPWPQGRREQIRLPYFNFATPPLSPDLQAAILPGREGCWDTSANPEFVPLRSRREDRFRQLRRVARDRAPRPSRLGEARAQPRFSRASAMSSSRRNGTG